jgi:hypothetical protein
LKQKEKKEGEKERMRFHWNGKEDRSKKGKQSSKNPCLILRRKKFGKVILPCFRWFSLVLLIKLHFIVDLFNCNSSNSQYT